MNTRPTKKYQAPNLILITCLILMIGISACGTPTSTPTPSPRFVYLVRVQVKGTNVDLAGAQVCIEVASQAPLHEVTDTNGTAIFPIDSSKEGQQARLIVNAPDYKEYVLNINLIKDMLPAVIQLEAEQSTPFPTVTNTSFPTLEPTETSSSTPQISCPWILYLNGASTSSLSDENCLGDVKVKGIGVSGDTKRISFYVARSPARGTYGVCRDISDQDNLGFSVMLQNDITSARFLIAIGPDPVPGKSAYAFRIQPESASHEMYVKFIQYTAGFPKDIDKIQASLNWIHLDTWKFDFAFEFSGSKVSASMNKKLHEEWQLNPSSRYLCFAYEAMPTAAQSTHLDAYITFP